MIRVNEDKYAFTGRLSELAQKADREVISVEYKYFPKHYTEMIRIKYTRSERYIDVTADSLSAILNEVSKELSGQGATGAVNNTKHVQLIRQWWNEDEQNTKATN